MISPPFISKWNVYQEDCDLASCLELLAAQWANLMWILGSNCGALQSRSGCSVGFVLFNTLRDTHVQSHIGSGRYFFQPLPDPNRLGREVRAINDNKSHVPGLEPGYGSLAPILDFLAEGDISEVRLDARPTVGSMA